MNFGLPKILRHESCWGLKLGHIGNTACEIWFCPPGYECKAHLHKNQVVNLRYIYGDAEFKIRKQGAWKTKYVTFWKDFFKKMVIGPEEAHSFINEKKWLIIFTRETYLNGYTPTSVSEDFQLYGGH